MNERADLLDLAGAAHRDRIHLRSPDESAFLTRAKGGKPMSRTIQPGVTVVESWVLPSAVRMFLKNRTMPNARARA